MLTLIPYHKVSKTCKDRENVRERFTLIYDKGGCMEPKQKTVCLRVKPETRDELKTVGTLGDTVDSVIKMLIREHKSRKKEAAEAGK
jgi:hypothetical protein